MIKIYTDASFYENYNQTDIVGGVGITAIFYDNYGEKIKEEYYESHVLEDSKQVS